MINLFPNGWLSTLGGSEYIKMNNKKIFSILFAIVVLGFFLRAYNLGEKSFAGDEFFDVAAAYGFHQTGQWKAWDFKTDAVAVDENLTEDIKKSRNERSWIYRWQVAQLFKIFPPAESVARLVSIFWGVISIVLMYFFSTYFTKNKTIGLLSAFLFSVSVSAIVLDRMLRMYAMFFPVFVAFSWSVYMLWEEKYAGKIGIIKLIQEKIIVNPVWILPTFLFGLLGYHLQPLVVDIAPVFFVYCLTQVIFVYFKTKSFFNKYVVAVATMFVAYLVVYFYFPQIIIGNSGIFEIFESNYAYVNRLSDNYSFFSVALVLMAYGSYMMFNDEKRFLSKRALWMALSYLVIIFLAIFVWSVGPFDRYIFIARSFEMTLLASGIFYVADCLRNNFKINKEKIFYLSLLVMLVLIPNWKFLSSDEGIYDDNPVRDELDYRSVFEYVKKNAQAGDVLITREYRNYYFSDLNLEVYDFGGEFNLQNKLISKDYLNKIRSENKSGWIVIPEKDNAFLKKGVLEYIEDNFEKKESKEIKGEGMVYYWNNN
ncbi:MAG: hypothetical protein ACD_8C00047G0011 [uncultured bacterium]|nr:MAG: hypothetical protein ACD_8C00047G0011 [uncultured bacterium]